MEFILGNFGTANADQIKEFLVGGFVDPGCPVIPKRLPRRVFDVEHGEKVSKTGAITGQFFGERALRPGRVFLPIWISIGIGPDFLRTLHVVLG